MKTIKFLLPILFASFSVMETVSAKTPLYHNGLNTEKCSRELSSQFKSNALDDLDSVCEGKSREFVVCAIDLLTATQVPATDDWGNLIKVEQKLGNPRAVEAVCTAKSVVDSQFIGCVSELYLRGGMVIPKGINFCLKGYSKPLNDCITRRYTSRKFDAEQALKSCQREYDPVERAKALAEERSRANWEQQQNQEAQREAEARAEYDRQRAQAQADAQSRQQQQPQHQTGGGTSNSQVDNDSNVISDLPGFD